MAPPKTILRGVVTFFCCAGRPSPAGTSRPWRPPLMWLSRPRRTGWSSPTCRRSAAGRPLMTPPSRQSTSTGRPSCPPTWWPSLWVRRVSSSLSSADFLLYLVRVPVPNIIALLFRRVWLRGRGDGGGHCREGKIFDSLHHFSVYHPSDTNPVL